MTFRERIVIDTNVLVSPLRAQGGCRETASHIEATLGALADVLSRPQFDACVSVGNRQEFLRLLDRVAEMVPVSYTIRACRDAKDDTYSR